MTAHPPRAALAALPIAFLIALLSTAVDAALLAWALGSSAALLANPRALALIAVWAAGNSLLTLGRPPHGAKRAPGQADTPLVIAALFVLPLAAAPLAAWGERAGITPLLPGNGAHWLGVGLVALGLALRVAAMARLGSRFTPLVAMQPEHALETGGPYAHVRHPGYVGAWLAALGGALSFGSALGLVPVVLLVPAIVARVRREEHALEAHFGESYRRWRNSTGAFWPRPGSPR